MVEEAGERVVQADRRAPAGGAGQPLVVAQQQRIVIRPEARSVDPHADGTGGQRQKPIEDSLHRMSGSGADVVDGAALPAVHQGLVRCHGIADVEDVATGV